MPGHNNWRHHLELHAGQVGGDKWQKLQLPRTHRHAPPQPTSSKSILSPSVRIVTNNRHHGIVRGRPPLPPSRHHRSDDEDDGAHWRRRSLCIRCSEHPRSAERGTMGSFRPEWWHNWYFRYDLLDEYGLSFRVDF